jgi:hypothetical protein
LLRCNYGVKQRVGCFVRYQILTLQFVQFGQRPGVFVQIEIVHSQYCFA